MQKNLALSIKTSISGLAALAFWSGHGVALAVSHCVNGPPIDETALNASLSNLSLSPCNLTTDPNCDNPGGQSHEVFWNNSLLGAGDLEDELVVLLPGSRQNPSNLTWIGKASAYAGYRTVILAYEGDRLEDVANNCSTDYSTCVREFRRDVILGNPVPSAATDIHPANSVEQRLLDVLDRLHTLNPADGWDTYRTGANLNHNEIIVSGFSLGSGHASFWAKIEQFAGVVTISGPTDSECVDFPYDRSLHPGLYYPLGCTNTLAAWIRANNHDTPGSDRYGIFHRDEALFGKLDVLIRAWDSFGLPRLPGNHLVMDFTDAYDFTTQQPWPLTAEGHRFSFNSSYAGSCSAHQAAAADRCLEIDPGNSSLPLVFPMYMNLYCAAGDDLI